LSVDVLKFYFPPTFGTHPFRPYFLCGHCGPCVGYKERIIRIYKPTGCRIIYCKFICISRGGCRILVRGGQISDCNSLSGLNPLTNRVLNKKIII
jgi:hypothetical protein